jgi:hypothetical protein
VHNGAQILHIGPLNWCHRPSHEADMSGDQQVLDGNGEFARQLRGGAASLRSLAAELDAAAAGRTRLHARGSRQLVGWAEVVLGDWPALSHELSIGLRGDAVAARSHASRAGTSAHGDAGIMFGVDVARAVASIANGDATAAYESLRCATDAGPPD